MADKRTDSGQFYPGGNIIPRQPVRPGGGSDVDAVHYYAETKTDAQKAQARANIGAMAADTPIPSVDGKLPVKPLPKYLHALAFDDPYKADAEAWYESLAPDAIGGACSAVRRGGLLFRNYDWPFDSAAEFVVRMSAAEGRHASVGVASLGAALTEDEVASGVYTAKFRALPGMTLDGINDAGVVCEINVDGGPKTGWHGDADDEGIHILAAVRWALDNGTSAAQIAEWLADHIIQPTGDMNFHFMVADATKTYIVENGAAHDVTDGTKVLTNYALYDEAHAGGGKERYQLLADGEDISAVLWTKAYAEGNTWHSDFESEAQHLSAIEQWAEQGADKEAHRGRTTTGGSPWWQTVHTSVYDFAAKTMRVAVQESDEWFVFAVDAVPPSVTVDDTVTQTSANPVKSSGIWSWVTSLLPSWLTPSREEPPTRASVNAIVQELEKKIPYDEWGGISMPEFNFKIDGKDRGSLSTGGVFIKDSDGNTKTNLNWPQGEGTIAKTTDIPALAAPSSTATDAQAAKAKATYDLIKPKADRASIAPEYDEESDYTVGQFVFHGGKIYQCTTAIADGGEAWNPAHWAERKLDDFFKNSNPLLTATIDARLPYPLNTDGTIIDRRVNVVTSGAFVIPEGFNDLLIRYTGVPASLTFSGTDASITDWGDDLPTETGDYLITVTRIAAAECYIRIIKLEARA